MKAIDRRLRRLEESFALQENEEVGRLVTLLRGRRRRRLEASGEPSDDPPLESLDGTRRVPQSIAEIWRNGRRCVASL